jgi:DNA repair exonuclease SbcCD ATPase subunit
VYLKSIAGDDELAAHKRLAEERNRVLDRRKQEVEDERAKLKQRLASLAPLKSNANVLNEIDKLEAAINDAKKQIEAIEDASHEFNLNLELKNAQAKQQRTFSINETRNSRLVVVVGWVIAIIGLALAFWGFWGWYKRIQVFQDEILKKQATATINGSALTKTDASETAGSAKDAD